MRLSFGKFRLLVEGPEEILERLSSQYPKYLTEDGLSDFVLRFRTAEEGEFDERLPEGWSFSERGGCQRLEYSLNGRTKFVLQTGETEREIIVIVRKSDDISLKIAMQYGVMLVLRKHCVGLHGATVLCGDKTVVLSAPSGTGKTTLAHLLEKYGDAIVINGDFALLSVDGDSVIFEPTPFCGTSGRCLNHRFRVDRVVFLEQAKENQWEELSGREALSRFMSNSFIPVGNGDARQAIQESILEMLARIQVSSFAFAPDQKAAECFLDTIR